MSLYEMYQGLIHIDLSGVPWWGWVGLVFCILQVVSMRSWR